MQSLHVLCLLIHEQRLVPTDLSLGRTEASPTQVMSIETFPFILYLSPVIPYYIYQSSISTIRNIQLMRMRYDTAN